MKPVRTNIYWLNRFLIFIGAIIVLITVYYIGQHNAHEKPPQKIREVIIRNDHAADSLVLYYRLLEGTMLREGFMSQTYSDSTNTYIYFGHQTKQGEVYYHTFQDGYNYMKKDLNYFISLVQQDYPDLPYNHVLAYASMSYRYGYSGMRRYGKMNEFEKELWNE